VLEQDYLQQVEEGKNWVKETVCRFANEMGIPIEYLEWGSGKNDFEQDRLSLLIIS